MLVRFDSSLEMRLGCVKIDKVNKDMERITLRIEKTRACFSYHVTSRIVGWVYACGQGDNLYLEDLHVRTEFQHVGIGNKLLREVIDFAERSFYRSITLLAVPNGYSKDSRKSLDSGALRRFYEKRGFRNLGLDRPYETAMVRYL